MEDDFDEPIRILERWATRGEKLLENGTRLICPTPHIAPQAWLHVLFPPLSDEGVRQLAELSGFDLPDDFRSFLQRSNGARLFSEISIWGRRRSYVRVGDDAWQPYDLLDHNTASMLPAGSPSTVLYFGGDDRGSNWCYFEGYEGGYRVGETLRNDFSPIQYWPGFSQWLRERIDTYSSLYDAEGKKTMKVR